MVVSLLCLSTVSCRNNTNKPPISFAKYILGENSVSPELRGNVIFIVILSWTVTLNILSLTYGSVHATEELG